jgi:hypothetical protein
MLVSSIAHFNAMSHRQAAQNNIMNIHMNMMSAMRGINSGAFAGEQGFAQIQEMGDRMEMELEQNKFDLLMYSLMEKYYKQQHAQKIKEIFGNGNSNNNGLDITA